MRSRAERRPPGSSRRGRAWSRNGWSSSRPESNWLYRPCPQPLMAGMKQAVLLLLVAGCSAPAVHEPGLRVGTCTVDITPPVGYRLGGYFKDRFAKEIRDPLFAKALVFVQGSTRAAIVTTDLVGVPAWI